MIRARRSLAVFCLALLLLVALIPGSPGLLFAALIPVSLLAAVVALAEQIRRSDDRQPEAFVDFPAIPPRAPPIFLS